MIRPISNFTTINSKARSCNYATNSKHLTQTKSSEMDTVSFSARKFSKAQIGDCNDVIAKHLGMQALGMFSSGFLVTIKFGGKECAKDMLKEMGKALGLSEVISEKIISTMDLKGATKIHNIGTDYWTNMANQFVEKAKKT